MVGQLKKGNRGLTDEEKKSLELKIKKAFSSNDGRPLKKGITGFRPDKPKDAAASGERPSKITKQKPRQRVSFAAPTTPVQQPPYLNDNNGGGNYMNVINNYHLHGNFTYNLAYQPAGEQPITAANAGLDQQQGYENGIYNSHFHDDISYSYPSQPAGEWPIAAPSAGFEQQYGSGVAMHDGHFRGGFNYDISSQPAGARPIAAPSAGFEQQYSHDNGIYNNDIHGGVTFDLPYRPAGNGNYRFASQPTNQPVASVSPGYGGPAPHFINSGSHESFQLNVANNDTGLFPSPQAEQLAAPVGSVSTTLPEPVPGIDSSVDGKAKTICSDPQDVDFNDYINFSDDPCL